MDSTKKKVTRKDLPIIKGSIPVECIVVDGKTINITSLPPSRSIENFITHDDCQDCGKEFEKKYTYQRYCGECLEYSKRKRYYALQEVEWDGETPLVIFEDDAYFFTEDDITSYCEDNECQPSDLMLVLCKKSNLSQIDLEYWADDTHEDWEPSDELVRRLQEFNDFLAKESSNTWFEGNRRVTLKMEVKND